MGDSKAGPHAGFKEASQQESRGSIAGPGQSLKGSCINKGRQGLHVFILFLPQQLELGYRSRGRGTRNWPGQAPCSYLL